MPRSSWSSVRRRVSVAGLSGRRPASSEVDPLPPPPLYQPTDSRASLLRRAADGPDADSLVIARHLALLRNFRTATYILKSLDLLALTLPDRCFVGMTFLNSQSGLDSDQFLKHQLREVEARPLAPSAIVRLAEWIQFSGLTTSLKLEYLRGLQVVDGNAVSFAAAHRALRYREFRVLKAALEPVDPLDYFRPEEDPYRWRDNLWWVNDLIRHGHRDHATRLLEAQLAMRGLTDAGVASSVLCFDGGALIEDLSLISEDLRGTPGILGIAADQRSASPAHRDFFESCLKLALSRFGLMDIFTQDSLLRVLATRGLLAELRELTEDPLAFPDTMLGVRCGSGLTALDDESNRDAAELFQQVLTEDPAFNAAATGLRFALARVGGGTTVIDVRNETGYGARGAGRPGVRSGDSDQTTSLLLSGQYLKSWSARRTASHWQTLKRQFGGKFLNFEPLPVDVGGECFIIGDEGVGDEVRAAQFYGEVAKHFSVTATCDPRLQTMLERSYPDIRFLPVARRIRGRDNAVYDGRYSDTILASHLPAELDTEVAAADHVTFGQNLTFNGFAGVLPTARTGAYLRTDPALAVPRHPSALKVGLIWRSHLTHGFRRMMYLDLGQFAPLFDVPGVEFWSVQHAISPEEVEFCDAHGIRQIEDVDLFDDLEGLAAHLESMDLVIGISTLPMELAAAVGTPIWALGFSPENYFFRTAGGTTSIDQLTRNSTLVAPPWIDFTQPHQECVDLVMTDCRDRLAALARSRADTGLPRK